MIDFQEYKKGYLNMDLLRFTTAGSVDDGKSTLIGRLLYDSKAIFEDQLEAIERTSKKKGDEQLNLALLTDGLKAEREQGITIDVAYRYFATPKRKFIIADTPGHIQYTRNMVTGASTADLALILVDARNGILEQTIRHTYIATLLQIPHVVVCINKMDLVDYSMEVYSKIKEEFGQIAEKIGVHNMHCIPISAKFGDNVVTRSENLKWFNGLPLLEYLEQVQVKNTDFNQARFPVQYVVRPESDLYHDYRGYAGQLCSGILKVGDAVKVLPSGLSSHIKAIHGLNSPLNEADKNQAITVLLEDDIDISRGDMIVPEAEEPCINNELDLMVCWFNPVALRMGGKYVIRHTTRELRGLIKDINFKVNINTLDKNFEDKQIKMNDIANIKIKTTQPLFFDSYNKNRLTGSVIFVDEVSNETVAAGMII